MKVTLVFVTTLDGKITRWGDPDVKSWSSEEDKEHFRQMWHQARLIVMGSGTFDAETITPSEQRRIIVMTQRTEDYRERTIPGCLEFTDEMPAMLVERLREEGFREMMLVGGAKLATSFFKEKLIDEMVITMEPRIFGLGGNFVTDKSLDTILHLTEMKRMNEQGTLLLRYKVEKSDG